MSIFTRNFVEQAVERAVKTAAQAAVAVLSIDGLGLLDVDWVGLGSATGLAALLSLLTSVASGRVGDKSASAVRIETVNGDHRRGGPSVPPPPA